MNENELKAIIEQSVERFDHLRMVEKFNILWTLEKFIFNMIFV